MNSNEKKAQQQQIDGSRRYLANVMNIESENSQNDDIVAWWYSEIEESEREREKLEKFNQGVV